MAIISSVIAANVAQKDGRRWIQEIHTDQVGATYSRFYLAQATTNAATNMAAYAITLWASIVAGEISANVSAVETSGSLAVPKFNYSTLTQLLTALAATYPTLAQMQAIMVGDYLNTMTQANLMTAFGKTAVQYTTLKNSFLTPAATAATTIRATVGSA
jgi:hypothetical protein